MKSKLKIGATFIAGKGVVARVHEITNLFVIVKVVKNDALETISIPKAIEYIEDGWWKFIVNPNEIWKNLNEV